MAIIRLILKVTSWIALAVGLVWSGKVTADDFKETPKAVVAPAIVDLSEALTFTQSIAKAGEVPVWFALGGLSGRALENANLILSDLKSNYGTSILEVRYGLETSFPAGHNWQIKVSEMAFSDGGSLFKEENPLLFLGQNTLSFSTPGAYKFDVRFLDPKSSQVNLEDVFEEFDFHLVIGNQTEDIQLFTAEDSYPGLLLLAGMFGVFIHLFLVVIHFIVPLQDAIPMDEIEI